ncbi:MAG: phosphate ABC transporter permease PstA [Verrucomicrobiota bacterium JB022]|nr:phosphate ABC transporter permease PstA [Verrucomicrobiota bacterium JB022]
MSATPEVSAVPHPPSQATNERRHVKPPAGEGFVWLTAMGLGVGIIMILGLLALILFKGVQTFWPRDIHVVHVAEESPFTLGGRTTFAGSIADERYKRLASPEGEEQAREYQFFVGNRDTFGLSFFYVDEDAIVSWEQPQELMQAERLSWGDAIFYPVSITKADGSVIGVEETGFPTTLRHIMKDAHERREQIREINRNEIGPISHEIVETERRIRLLKEEGATAEDPRIQSLQTGIAKLQAESRHLQEKVTQLRARNEVEQFTTRLVSGEEKTEPVSNFVKIWQPNEMGFFAKLGWFFGDFWSFISEEPREANTEGGIFPTIFGTVVLVMMMSAAVMPFGVIAAIYLREYATQGPFVQMVRISINNLAGVPSIVYGVFGLGFFVYFLGGTIDELFFPNHESAVFKSGGVLWAALTLALMTVPVVVVATEEAFAAVPAGLREASLACGASKWQTIQRVVLPAAAPGMLTGLILAIARGAGEVAPLMLVGVVKLAPSLPLDGQAPFVHFERKFMHLGFHIFDLGFQSPDSEAAKPMVFATTFLLIMLVVVLNLGAILIRERLRKKYAYGSF